MRAAFAVAYGLQTEERVWLDFQVGEVGNFRYYLYYAITFHSVTVTIIIK